VAIGAAKWITHNVLDLPRPVAAQRADFGLVLPYLGVIWSDEQIESALAAFAGQIVVTQPADPALAAAEDVAANKVIGWFEGRSEIGPRALGHRSILADARKPENWPRLNELKHRESWRPFAPAVLASESNRWFAGIPLPSPCMLFTGTVLSDQLPAITHADGSTRLQTVDDSCGVFHRVLVHYFELTGTPVVLNTSLNGPGEPIVEAPIDALRFLLNSSLDALYVEGHRITRAPSPMHVSCVERTVGG